MTKIISLLLALVMVLSLAACGAKEEAPAETQAAAAPEAPAAAEKVDLDVVIAQYTHYTAEWWKEFEADFEAANTDINLNIEIISWNDITAQISSRIQTGEQPDILNISPFSTYVGDDLLAPVDEYVSDTVKANIIPSFYEANTVDGTVWALPILASVRCMLVNTDILAQAGVEKIPTTDTRYPLQDAFSAGKMAMLLAPMNAVAADSTINFEFAPFPTASADITPASMGVSDQFMVFRDEESKNEEARQLPAPSSSMPSTLWKPMLTTWSSKASCPQPWMPVNTWQPTLTSTPTARVLLATTSISLCSAPWLPTPSSTPRQNWSGSMLRSVLSMPSSRSVRV